MKLPDGYVNGVAPPKPTAMGGFGQSMLEKMGWQKGDGLGKERQGRNTHVEVSLKDDKCGLGGKFMWDWEKDYASTAFDNAVAKIQGATDSSDSDSSDSDSDEDNVVHLDGTASSAKAADLKLSRQLAKGNSLGRFGSRAGKLARVREQEAKEMAAMGLSVPSKSNVQDATESKKRGRESDAPALPKVKRIVYEIMSATLVDNSQPQQPPSKQPENWWGHSQFASAGWLGGMGDDESTRKRQEFSENTQEDIYMRLHDQQTKGRRGMGKRALKVGGGWEGSKTTFDEPDEGPETEAKEPEAAEKKKKSKSKKDQQKGAQEGDKQGDVANAKSQKKQRIASTDQDKGEPNKSDFMKAVKKELAATKKGLLKQSKLCKQVADRIGSSPKSVSKLVQKHVASGKLIEDDGRIRLPVVS